MSLAMCNVASRAASFTPRIGIIVSHQLFARDTRVRENKSQYLSHELTPTYTHHIYANKHSSTYTRKITNLSIQFCRSLIGDTPCVILIKKLRMWEKSRKQISS